MRKHDEDDKRTRSDKISTLLTYVGIAQTVAFGFTELLVTFGWASIFQSANVVDNKWQVTIRRGKTFSEKFSSTDYENHLLGMQCTREQSLFSLTSSELQNKEGNNISFCFDLTLYWNSLNKPIVNMCTQIRQLACLSLSSVGRIYWLMG